MDLINKFESSPTHHFNPQSITFYPIYFTNLFGLYFYYFPLIWSVLEPISQNIILSIADTKGFGTLSHFQFKELGKLGGILEVEGQGNVIDRSVAVN